MNDNPFQSIVAAFPGKRILVVGDVMVDEYVWGKVSRISPEAPVPVVDVDRVSHMPGGAANVASNIASLGGIVYLAGVIGDDEPAHKLVSILSNVGIMSEGLVVSRGRPTTLKTRIVAHNQYVCRADRESREAISETVRDALWQYIARTVGEVDICLMSDYGKGVLSPFLLDETIGLARRLRKPVVVDPKGTDFLRYSGATVITPNKVEAGRAVHQEISCEEDLARVGKMLISVLGCKAVLITRGEEGVSLFENDGSVTNIPALVRTIYEVTGAGDTAVAALALALAAGAAPAEAAYLGNCAAGVVVGKVGTATVTPEELGRAVQEAPRPQAGVTADEVRPAEMSTRKTRR